MSSPRAAAASAALASLVLALAACRTAPPAEETAQPFVFRELNLLQRDPQGRRLWAITSPEARYDLNRRLAQARQLRGMLYAEGKPLYRVSASNAVVVNDGEVVLVEGPSEVVRLDPHRPAVITARRLRWYPAQERMEIDRAPRATQGDLELTAGLARFQIDADRLELRDRPVLRQKGAEPVRLELGPVDWSPGTGALRAKGPVRGSRRLTGGTFQQLAAPSLTGNTRNQTVDLVAPVRLSDPSRDATLEAQATQLDLRQRLVSSSLPFQGAYGRSTLRGGSFVLNGVANTVLVRDGCDLRQPGDTLSAGQCFWNWTSGAVAASGGVVLRRQANGLSTRAARLEGVIGRNGQISFQTPGGRVTTQLQVPTRPAREGLKPNTPPKAPPFQL